jgi:hypothetical protein
MAPLDGDYPGFRQRLELLKYIGELFAYAMVGFLSDKQDSVDLSSRPSSSESAGNASLAMRWQRGTKGQNVGFRRMSEGVPSRVTKVNGFGLSCESLRFCEFSVSLLRSEIGESDNG